MSEEKTNDFLIRENIGRLMRRYSLPCIISLVTAALYNIVDQIFIANADYLGSFGNAANTVVYPLTVIALAFAVLIGDGCCAFVSICLGQGRKKDAEKSVGSAVVLSIITGIVIMAAYLLLQNTLIRIFGGTVNEETFHFSQQYFLWITLGIPFYVFGQAMNPVIRSDGSPKFAMISTVLGAVVNIILDPVFIYACRWGMAGAALATDLGQILTAVLSAWYLSHMKALKLEKECFHLSPSLIHRFIPLGMTSLLSQISLVASMAVINNMIRKYGALDPVFSQAAYAQIPMAVVGIVMKFFQIVISIAVGMAAGCIPVVGYNIGAGRKDRAKNMFSLLLLSEAVTGLIAFVIVEFFPDKIIALFGSAQESSYYTSFAIKAFRIYLCLIIPALINKGTFIYLQALGKAAVSTVLSTIREIVFGVGFALILPHFFGLDGVLYSMPVSDALTFILTIIVVVKTYRELGTTESESLHHLAGTHS